jgi:hypothetical protein
VKIKKIIYISNQINQKLYVLVDEKKSLAINKNEK